MMMTMTMKEEEEESGGNTSRCLGGSQLHVKASYVIKCSVEGAAHP